MANSNRQWYSVNPQGEQKPTDMTSRTTIFTPPKTDIWRPSPSQDDFNAPFIYTSIKSAAFRKVSTSISANWKTLYDQGGIIINWPASPRNQSRWVKTGIEFFQGKPALSVVGNDRFSDWSLCPMPSADATEARIEAERVDQTLWIYVVVGNERLPLREIKWAFLEDRDADAEMWVGIYAAKPTPEAEGDLKTGIEVTFEDLQLETK